MGWGLMENRMEVGRGGSHEEEEDEVPLGRPKVQNKI
jgi:hypothetical protein